MDKRFKNIDKAILHSIISMSEENLYKNFTQLEINGFEKKDITYRANTLFKKGYIKAAVLEHNTGIEGIIVKGITDKGLSYYEDITSSFTKKFWKSYKEQLDEKLYSKLASGTLIIVGIILTLIIQFFIELIF